METETQLTIIDYHAEVRRQVQDTSRESYKQFCNSNQKETQYIIIKKHLAALGEANNVEISHATGILINAITARVKELRDKGEIVYAGKRKYLPTNQTVMNWRIKAK